MSYEPPAETRYRQTVLIELMGPTEEAVFTARLRLEKSVSALTLELSRLKGGAQVVAIPDKKIRDAAEKTKG